MFKIYNAEKRIVIHIETGKLYSTASVEYRDWLLEGNTPEQEDYDYAARRREKYPPIADQLDMIYHDQEAWAAEIAAIKSQFPKEACKLPLPAWVEEERKEFANPPPVLP